MQRDGTADLPNPSRTFVSAVGTGAHTFQSQNRRRGTDYVWCGPSCIQIERLFLSFSITFRIEHSYRHPSTGTIDKQPFFPGKDHNIDRSTSLAVLSIVFSACQPKEIRQI
jgi:hypothetical protein